jgi:hypothetical protein
MNEHTKLSSLEEIAKLFCLILMFEIQTQALLLVFYFKLGYK